MDPVIYSASPIQAFLGTIGGVAFMFFLGVAGGGWALFRRNEATAARIAAGCASLVVLAAAAGLAFFSVSSALGGDQTVTVLLDRKRVVNSNCESGTCTSYVLETHAGQIYYDFTVARSAFDKAEEGACYAVTYYPPNSIQDETPAYQTAFNITRIEKVNCP